MPDFHLPERTATLIFEDGDLKGLELTVRLSLPFDALFKLQTLSQEANDTAGMDKLQELLHYFTERALVGWNLSNGSGPVELTPASFTAHLDPINAGALLRRYLEAVGGIPGPLAPRSASGSTSRGRRASNNPPS